ncbi:MAG: RluA family pseudouridine synthase [Erysipelotrichaceae bacterium]|nr:RluA family pseudouridine synthase [Erysipelotrichaceae bacterium]
MNFKVDQAESNIRLDKYLSLKCPTKSRTFLAKLIDDGEVKVNGKTSKASFKLSTNDEVEINIPIDKPLEVSAEDIPLDIVYEDQDILIINKPQGLVVHPAPGHYEHTLVNAILNHCSDLSGINGVIRPGIVHRIDKDTSGLICIAKNDEAHHFLSEQLKDHTMNREYYALVKGVIKENHGKIDMPIGRSRADRKKMAVNKENGKDAITFFDVVERYKDHTLIKCKLVTGRTHQIRVHMAYINHPVEGDPLYNKRNAHLLADNGQLLVAYKLNLIHPRTKKEVSFEIPLPQYFLDIISKLS